MELSLTFQHLPPEVLSRGQPWTPVRVLGRSVSGCAPRTHRLGWVCPLVTVLGCQPMMLPSASGSSIHPHCPTPFCIWDCPQSRRLLPGHAPVALTTNSVGGQRTFDCLSGCTVLLKKTPSQAPSEGSQKGGGALGQRGEGVRYRGPGTRIITGPGP